MTTPHCSKRDNFFIVFHGGMENNIRKNSNLYRRLKGLRNKV